MAPRSSLSTVSLVRKAHEAPPLTARLSVVHPRALACSVQLREAALEIGRSPEAAGALKLDSRTVSRRHLEIVWDGTQRAHVARDLKSHNGTVLDGRTLDGAGDGRALGDGSVLRLGDVLLVYESHTGDVADPPEVARDAAPGRAFSMVQLRAALARSATDAAPVLLLGETGTGKEHLAAEVHRLSGRKGRLLAVNCAELNAQLVESQLFGHVRGAFTGAADAQPGLFRAAHGGTLFLDEVGDLPLPLQPKLLRAVQEGQVQPVGGTQNVAVDVRVVAATHHDLARAAAAGTFRQDLYARLSLWEVAVPPLRARRVDLFDWIELLTRRHRAGAAPATFDADAAETLLLQAWPLNLRALDRLVRELGAVTDVDRGALPRWIAAVPLLAADDGDHDDADADAGAVAAPADAPTSPRAPARQPPTREEFEAAYARLGGSVHGLSRLFERDRRQIYRWIEAYGLRR